MSGDFVSKSVVSVSDMARMVGLSRARFYQLVKAGTFPSPETESTTGRPFYSQNKQQVCLEVRRRNCGIDGKAILFYARRRDFGSGKGKPPRPKLESKHKDILDGLNSLGLTTATAAQVQQVIDELFPNGMQGMAQGDLLKAVFLEIRRRNSGGSG